MLGLYGFCEGLLADRQPSLDILQLPLEAFLLHAFTTLGVYSAPAINAYRIEDDSYNAHNFLIFQIRYVCTVTLIRQLKFHMQ